MNLNQKIIWFYKENIQNTYKMKNLSNENKLLIGAGVVTIGVIGFLYFKNRKNKIKQEQSGESTLQLPETATQPINSNPNTSAPVNTTVALNKDMILKKGSKGLEVRELQKKLRIKADGDFGKNTIVALKKQKNVSEITLNDFDLKKNETSEAPVKDFPKPKPNAKLMAVKNGTKLYYANKTVAGTYIKSDYYIPNTLEVGEDVGIYRGYANGFYLVKKGVGFYFVKPENVRVY